MKKFFVYFSLAILTTMGIYVMVTAEGLPRTYNGRNTNIYELKGNNTAYSLDNTDGVADAIVKQNLNKTRALNVVNAVALDFRGYDALGQSFILLTVISGCAVILKSEKKGSDEPDEEKYKG